MRNNKRYAVVCLAAVVFVLSACSSSKAPMAGDNKTMFFERGYSDGAAPAAMSPAAAQMAPSPSTAPQMMSGVYDTSGEVGSEAKASKKVKTGQMEMEANDTDTAVIQLESAAAYYGGYVENKRVNANADDKWATITLRVPSEYYEVLVEDIYGIGEVYDFYDSVIDMSGEYYDIQSWLDVSLAEESRLLELIERTEKIEDIITLEMRLGDVRVDIAMYENRLKEINRKVGYSTLNINISQKSSPRIRNISKSLPDRMADAFISSANDIINFGENVLITLAYFSVPLVIIAACALIGRIVYKKTKK